MRAARVLLAKICGGEMTGRRAYYARHQPSNVWATPEHIFGPLDREFGFQTDVCATAGNAKCEIYYTPEQDGLSQDWRGVCWMNPPYGREIAQWVSKACEAARRGATVVALLPVRTDTGWWHDAVIGSGAEVRFIRGRINFGGERKTGHNAPFPSAIVIFRPDDGGLHLNGRTLDALTVDTARRDPEGLVRAFKGVLRRRVRQARELRAQLVAERENNKRGEATA